MSDGSGADFPPNFSDETADMGNEGAINPSSDLRKRRSTRIVQAVPLVVTGVDALGRPFAERTSTLIINCHGCRYQSKHYVLKNMWVNLEVPHPEPGHAPRRVRGKVAWIQRPRTVRQLFQVALELELPGNAWGIAFPPDDWFAFPQEEPALLSHAAAAGAETLPQMPPPAVGEMPLPLVEAEPGVAGPDNLRVFPAPASPTDASLQLARQVARLLAEAKQQIHAAAKEAAVQAVNAERRLAAEQWEQKYTNFREEVARETAHAVGVIQEESEARARTAQAAAAESLKNELPRWLAPQLEQLTHELTATLAREGSAQRDQHEKQLSSAQETLQTLSAQAEEAAAKLRVQAEQIESQFASRMQEAARRAEEEAQRREQAAGSQRELLSGTAQEIQDRVAAVHAEAQKTLQEQLERALQSASQAREQAEQAQTLLVAQMEAVARRVEERAEEDARQREAALAGHRELLSNTANELQQRLNAMQADAEKALQERLEREMQNATQMRAQAEQMEAQLIARLEEAARKAEERAEEEARKREAASSTQAETITAAVHDIQERMGAAQLEAKNALHEQLAREIEAAQARWMGTIEAAVAAAEERSSTKLREQTNELRTELREEGSRQTETVQRALENQTKRLEETLGKANEAGDRLEQFAGRIENIQQQAIGGFQSQLDDVLTLHRNELHRRSEILFEEIHNRIRGTFDATNTEALNRFEQQVQSLVAPHITQTEEAVHRLAGGRALLDAAMTMQQDRIRNSADEAFAEAMGRFRENLGSVEQVLADSASAITNRSLEDLESKAGDVKHHALEEMYKSAEWYEKKAQSQLQHLTEKFVEQAGTQLRERAGEVSSLFTTELSHASNSYVSQTQQQMEETVRDSFERVRMLFAEAADTTSAAFTDEIQRNARQELAGFNELMSKSSEESRERLEAHREQVRQQVNTEQAEFLRRFQSTMQEAVEKSLGQAQEKAQANFGNLMDSWKSVSDAKQQELRDSFASISNQAAEGYRSRLENISNSWMVATVTTLDHQSRDVIAKIAATAEERLREASAEVFSKFGDTLKERLQQIAKGFDNPGSTKS